MVIRKDSPICLYLSLYLCITGIYLLSGSGRIGLSDGVAMFNVARSVVDERSLSSEPCDPKEPGQPNHCVPGINGRYYSGFGLVPSLLAGPAVLLGERIGARVHINPSGVSRVMVSLFTALVSPLACVVLAMWIVRLGYSRRTAALGAGILAFASPFWHFGVKGFYSEPYTTLALLIAAYLLSCRELPYAAAFSGLAFGVACGCRINTVILFPAFLLSLALHIRARGLTLAQLLREAGLFTASFSACALLIGFANYTRFGSPMKTGYHLVYPSASLLFSTPLFHGIYELLFNGEVGLLVFAPWFLVALACFPSFVRAHLPESVLCGTIFPLTFLFFAKYDSWHAGRVAGPRFLTPVLPFLVMAMVPCIQKLQYEGPLEYGSRTWRTLRTVLMVLVIASALTQFLGVLFPEDRYYALMGLYSDARQVGFYGGSPTIIGLYRGTRVRPWWTGSITLASIDFLRRMDHADGPSARPVELVEHDQTTAARQEAQMRAAMSAAKTEEDYLRAFPNSENLMLPNLMVFKLKLLGLPASAAYAFGLSMVFVGVMGLIGLKRYTTPDQELIKGV